MSDPFQIGRRLQEQKDQHLYRQRRILETAQSHRVRCNGQDLINFCSNDYLGLANHPRVIKAAQHAAQQFGVGSGASHLVVGHSALHEQLEERLADWVQRPRALLFSTGYMANVGVLSALLQRGDTVIQDKLNHASLLDGATQSRATLLRYQHNSVDHLQQRLASAKGRCLVATDAVFSMDGDVAPIEHIAQSCSRHNAWLMLDDAHGLGVLGQGRGVLQEYNLGLEQVPVYMATLGKALGTFGAFVAGDHDLIEFLIQFARPYIYTTAIPPAIAAATLESLQLLQQESWRVEQLQSRIAYFRQRASQAGLSLMPSTTAIQPLMVGASDRALRMSELLRDQGLLVGAIRPPTVPANTARLRVTLCAEHSELQIERLVDALAQAQKDQKPWH